MPAIKHRPHHATFALTLAAAGLAVGAPALADEGDGAPHIAVVDDGLGNLELEFAIPFGLDEGTNPPTINLVAPTFDAFTGGYATAPLNSTPTPNDDLGFVSELEGGSEGGSIAGNIVVQLISKDANFRAVFGPDEIFATPGSVYALGSAFDNHPIWVLGNTEGDLTPASASFEIFDIASGAIGSGNEASLGQFNINLAVPEPTSALALLAGAGLLAARRRRQ